MESLWLSGDLTALYVLPLDYRVEFWRLGGATEASQLSFFPVMRRGPITSLLHNRRFGTNLTGPSPQLPPDAI